MRVTVVALAGAVALLAGCSVGEGTGEVTSGKLFVEDCWDGEFDLNPSFFGADPGENNMFIRLQRGSNLAEKSDGLLIVINDVSAIRGNLLGQPIDRVGVPVGVNPPGQPIEPREPPLVSMTLYLNNTCGTQNAALSSVAGSMTFTSLFSGDIDERNADDRLSEASFTATFADPRSRQVDGTYPPGEASEITGWFRFFFQRGQPAQPFP